MYSPLATCKKLRLCPEKPDSGWRSEAKSKSLAGNYLINYVRPRLSLVTVFMYLVTIICNLNKTRRQMGRLMKGLRQRRKWNWALEGRVVLRQELRMYGVLQSHVLQSHVQIFVMGNEYMHGPNLSLVNKPQQSAPVVPCSIKCALGMSNIKESTVLRLRFGDI